ncbi:MAG: ABC transporter ATP-binding protein [Clostridiales bacterium]|nr:ABC transporter ATP-binding protein [Clostridiales bacterium]
MIKLLKLLGKYKKETVLGPLLKMAEALFELFVPLVVASLIDKGIKGGLGMPHILKMSLILVLFAFLGLLFSVCAQFFAAKAATGVVKHVRLKLFDHINKLGYPEIDKLGKATMITRLTSDVNQVQNGINLGLRLLLRSPFVVFGAMIMAFFVNKELAIIFVVVIPVLAVIVFSIMLVSIPLYKKVQQKLDKVLSSTRQNLSGTRVIRAFVKEKDEEQRFKEENTSLVKMQVLVGRISQLMNPLTYVVINLAIVFLIYKGAIKVEIGIISQGALVALYNYMSQILVELIKLANLIISITRAFACGNRIQSVLDLTPSQQNGTKKEFDFTKPIVEFDNASLIYGDNVEPSIENITFSVNKGETIGIIGGTGSGKTSLINLIPRFYDTFMGSCKVYGEDVKNYDTEFLRSVISIVPQKAELFKGTIRENILWGNENATDEQIMDALNKAQALDIVKSKELGLDAPVEQYGRNFSGGQKQRLTIARALLKDSQILILDDSASALDYKTDSLLMKAIKEMEDKTVFIVSQRTSSIRHADKIVLMDDGKIQAIGTHSELLEYSPLYREIHYQQVGGEDVE